MAKKCVAITQRLFRASEYYEIREGLDVRWGELFCAREWEFIPLSYAFPVELYFCKYNLSGVILSGGNDLSSFAHSPLNQKRDAYEREVLRLAKKRGAPILGICRGAEFIASELGGEIVRCADFGTNHVGEHLIFWGEESFCVNSYHNVAIKSLGFLEADSVRSLAHSKEGFIEAFKGDSVLGMMWHPEREESLSPASEKIFDLFEKMMKESR